jgi:hypothetical protein
VRTQRATHPTTTQAHYTEVLLRDMAGIALPLQRIHSTTLSSEPKAAVLARLAAQHPGASAYVFVEDKLSTLEKVRCAAVCAALLCARSCVVSSTQLRGQAAARAVRAHGSNVAAAAPAAFRTRAPGPSPPHTPVRLHSQVAADPATVDWQLFLVDWGYNTERERASARAHPRISVLDARGFAELMAGASVEA